MSVIMMRHYRENYFPDGTMRPSYRAELKARGRTDEEIERTARHQTDDYQRELRWERERRVNNPVTIRRGLTTQEALTEGFIDVDDL